MFEVAPGVVVWTSSVMSTNSTALVGDGRAMLVDPGWIPSELESIARDVAGRDAAVVGGFATHAHHDHLLWHPAFGDAPRWASATTAAMASQERDALVAALGPDWPADLIELMGRVDAVDAVIPADSLPAGVEVELLVHDGHAPGHTALWLPQSRVLIAGDMLSDVELPLPFYPDDLPAYLSALDLLSTVVRQAEVVIPGHGGVGRDASARLDADRRYIDDMIRRGDSDDPRIGNHDMEHAHAHMREITAHLR